MAGKISPKKRPATRLKSAGGLCIQIVKRRGHEERFDERKVYASVYAACLSSHVPHRQAEQIAGKVCRDINRWIDNRRGVTADQLFREITKALRHYQKDAAFMYETHRDLS